MKYGFERDDLASNLTLALGSQAVEPIKIARAYAAFANGGYLIEPYFIEEIRDRNGETLYLANAPQVCRDCDDEDLEADFVLDEFYELEISQPPRALADITGVNPEDTDDIDQIISETNSEPAPPEPIYAEQILDPRVHFIMDSILKDVIQRGTGVKARVLERGDIGGKTGTTNGPRDAWFSGYNPNLIATTWVGFDDNSILGSSEFGGTAALPIWIDFMRDALTDMPEYYFEQPEGLVIARINRRTGERASPEDPDAVFEYFLKENTPSLTAEMSGERTTDTNIKATDIF